MKKTIATIIVTLFCAILCVGIGQVEAYTKSSGRSSTKSCAGGSYRITSTATYNSNGNYRWSYSGEGAQYLSGTAARGYTISPSTGAQSDNGIVWRTSRNIRLNVTNINYVSDSTTVTFNWAINHATGTWQ